MRSKSSDIVEGKSFDLGKLSEWSNVFHTNRKQIYKGRLQYERKNLRMSTPKLKKSLFNFHKRLA